MAFCDTLIFEPTSSSILTHIQQTQLQRYTVRFQKDLWRHRHWSRQIHLIPGPQQLSRTDWLEKDRGINKRDDQWCRHRRRRHDQLLRVLTTDAFPLMMVPLMIVTMVSYDCDVWWMGISVRVIIRHARRRALQDPPSGLERSGQDKPIPKIHRVVHRQSDPNHRCVIQAEGDRPAGEADEGATLGHCGHWTLSHHHTHLLPKRRWSFTCLRPYWSRLLSQHPVLDRRVEWKGRRYGAADVGWKQKWPRGRKGGFFWVGQTKG